MADNVCVNITMEEQTKMNTLSEFSKTKGMLRNDRHGLLLPAAVFAYTRCVRIAVGGNVIFIKVDGVNRNRPFTRLFTSDKCLDGRNWEGGITLKHFQNDWSTREK